MDPFVLVMVVGIIFGWYVLGEILYGGAEDKKKKK